MKLSNNKYIVIALVAMLALVSAGGAMAAAPTVDTTDGGNGTSDIVEDGTQAYNATGYSTFQFSVDSSHPKVTISQNGSTLYSTTDPKLVNSTTHTYKVKLANNGTDYNGMTVGAGENASLVVKVWNNTQADSPNTTLVNYTFVNNKSVAFYGVTDADTSDDDTTTFGSVSRWSLSSITSLWNSSSSSTDEVKPVSVTKTLKVSKNTSEVSMSITNESVQKALKQGVSDTDKGSPILTDEVKIDGQFVPVFEQGSDVPDWVDDDEAYATVSDDGSMATIHNANATVDKTQKVDITVIGDQKMGLFNAKGMFSDYGLSSYKAYSMSFGAATWNFPDGFDALSDN